MRQVDIRRMYSILAEYQEMDPETAKRVLRRILEILEERKRGQRNTKRVEIDT